MVVCFFAVTANCRGVLLSCCLFFFFFSEGRPRCPPPPSMSFSITLSSTRPLPFFFSVGPKFRCDIALHTSPVFFFLPDHPPPCSQPWSLSPCVSPLHKVPLMISGLFLVKKDAALVIFLFISPPCFNTIGDFSAFVPLESRFPSRFCMIP